MALSSPLPSAPPLPSPSASSSPLPSAPPSALVSAVAALTASLTGGVSLVALWWSWRAGADAKALSTAQYISADAIEFDPASTQLLNRANGKLLPAYDGEWVAMRGSAVAMNPSRVLRATHGQPALVMERNISVYNQSVGSVLAVENLGAAETWSEVPWGIANPRHPSTIAASIAPHATERTAQNCPRQIYTLLQDRTSSVSSQADGGIMWWLQTLGLAPVSEHVEKFLPVGCLVTIVAQANLRANNTIQLSVHPSLGFFASTLSFDELKRLYQGGSANAKRAARICGTISLIAVGVAIMSHPTTTRRVRNTARALRGRLQENSAYNWLCAALGWDPAPVEPAVGLEGGALSPGANVVDGADSLAQLAAEECIACAERRINTVLVPCGHECLCWTCAKRLRSSGVVAARRCPLCRASIVSISDIVARQDQ